MEKTAWRNGYAFLLTLTVKVVVSRLRTRVRTNLDLEKKKKKRTGRKEQVLTLVTVQSALFVS